MSVRRQGAGKPPARAASVPVVGFDDLFPDDHQLVPDGMPSLLLVDDDVDFAQVVAESATVKGFTVQLASGWREAERLLRTSSPELVLLGTTLADGNGLDLLEKIEPSQRARVVVLGAHTAEQATTIVLPYPVLDYMPRPLSGQRLHDLLDHAAALVNHRSHPHAPSRPHACIHRCGDLLSQSAAMMPVFATLQRVAPMQHTVLLHGESGTGKELAARALHQHSGRRGKFVAVNCGTLTELAGSQLFGHIRGSFTGAVSDHAGYFEQAHAGTLFLDEFTEMPAHIQTYLLRVLEEHAITRLGSCKHQSLDVRVIAASNRAPQHAVQVGTLRADLYYRLSEFSILLPPLRTRKGDVGMLAQHFVDQLNHQQGCAHQLSAHSMARLEAHSWPGNVRELQHVIGRAHVMAEGPWLDPQPDLCPAPLPKAFDIQVGQSLDDLERKAILLTLDHFGSDRAQAAEKLGISVKTLYNKLARYRQEDELGRGEKAVRGGARRKNSANRRRRRGDRV